MLAYHAGRGGPARVTLASVVAALLGLGAARGEASDATVAVMAGLLPFVGRFERVPGALLGLGRISYSLYLVHGFVGLGLSVAFRTPAVRSSGALAWAGVVAAVAFATLFYRVCEWPFVAVSRRVRVGPGRSPTDPPAAPGTATPVVRAVE